MNQQAYRPPTHFSVFPPVIKNLLILNGLVYLAQMVPTTNEMLIRWFALWPLGIPNLPGYPSFYPWQLVTYGFMHGGFGHLLFNMFALWMFGVQIENAWGSRRFGKIGRASCRERVERSGGQAAGQWRGGRR